MSELFVEGDRLSINFSLALEDGSEIDSNFDSSPVDMTIGDGNMLPGFERALTTFSVGQRGSVTLEAEEAFGLHQQENIQSFKLADFAEELDLQEGLVVGFVDAAGGELPGVIRSIDKASDKVDVDFNHPLAGRNIVFTVLIHSIQSSVETAH